MKSLRAGYVLLAQRLQEAAESLSSNELRDKLSAAVRNAHKNSDTYSYYQDHTGDEDDGDCIYNCGGDMMKAPYSKGTDTSDTDYTLDTSKAVKVVPRMTYEEQPDEGDHYAAMESAKLYTAGPMPLCERFVSKKERDAASSSDFAGKGKSFPILKAEDVAAAAASIGRAGSDNYSTDVIKRNIIRIAKAKGFTSELPKAWQDDSSDSKESAKAAIGDLKIRESLSFSVDIPVREALSVGRKIKLIAPGPGSTAYYTEAALKQAADDKIFHAGLPMRIDHPTKAEESARPEGSVKDWGAVLGSDAVWMESYISGGKDLGKGLYSDIKPFSDHSKTIEEKGPYAGVSIMANGRALTEAGHVVTKNGLPVLEKFTSAEGCDMVTRAGAGGLFLQESARDANLQESSMTAEEKALLQRLVEKDTKREAIEQGARMLEDLAVPPSAKMYIIETVIDRGVPTKDGTLDAAKFQESLNAEARRFGGAIGAGPRVTGMGAPPPVQITEAQRKEMADQQAAEDQVYKESWASLIGKSDDAMLTRAMKGRAA